MLVADALPVLLAGHSVGPDVVVVVFDAVVVHVDVLSAAVLGLDLGAAAADSEHRDEADSGFLLFGKTGFRLTRKSCF